MEQDQTVSYWQSSSPLFTLGQKDAVEGDFDVAIIGGGFSGLSAALAFAKQGVKVALLEAANIMGAASGRNGGQCNAGTAHDFGGLVASHGIEKARRWYIAHCDAVDTVERIAAEENIDCSFNRCGKAKLAAKPQHFDMLEKAYHVLKRDIDPNVSLVAPQDIKTEIGSNEFYGAMIQHTSAQLHVGRFGIGMADAAVKKGAFIWEHAPVKSMTKIAGKWRLDTPKGHINAAQVLVATGGSSPYKPFSWFRRRIVSVGSFAIATAPLPQVTIDELFPKKRNYVTTRIIGNYFRLAPDNRLIFGGRARFALSNPTSDYKSAGVLEAAMHKMFPILADTPIEHRWGGTIDMTADRLPRAGEHDGLFYCMGYSGHGVQMATHMGQQMSKVMGGDASENPFEDLPWSAIPGYVGTPWFLPFVGVWYKLQDSLH